VHWVSLLSIGYFGAKYLAGLENLDICSWLFKERLTTSLLSHRCNCLSTNHEWGCAELGEIGFI